MLSRHIQWMRFHQKIHKYSARKQHRLHWPTTSVKVRARSAMHQIYHSLAHRSTTLSCNRVQVALVAVIDLQPAQLVLLTAIHLRSPRRHQLHRHQCRAAFPPRQSLETTQDSHFRHLFVRSAQVPTLPMMVSVAETQLYILSFSPVIHLQVALTHRNSLNASRVHAGQAYR